METKPQTTATFRDTLSALEKNPGSREAQNLETSSRHYRGLLAPNPRPTKSEIRDLPARDSGPDAPPTETP